jgi:hypothetical protein
MILDNIEEKSWKDIIKVKCEKCNKERNVKYITAKYKKEHLCRKCSVSGENHPNWGKKLSKELKKKISLGNIRKGWRKQGGGYKAVLVDDHPRSKPYRGGRYIMEHILVIEKQIGRHLEEHEIIHHIDGDKLNNTPENLFLCSGQDRKESNQIHNHSHDTAEKLIFELYKKGLIKFENGEYKMSEELKNFVSKEQIISLNFDNLGIPNCSCHGIVRDNK